MRIAKQVAGLLFTLLVYWGRMPAAHAQQRQYAHNTNGWYMYVGDHKFKSQGKWGVHLEAQLRMNEVLLKGQQLLLRTGLNYYLNNAAFVTAGYAFVETYPYGDFAAKSRFPEHRIWEQLQLKNQQGAFELVSRFRLEQRFVHSPVLHDSVYEPGNAVYSNRFRFLQRVSIPLQGKTIEDHSFYLTAYDEMFVAFGKNVGKNIFDQNRAYVALGYKFPKVGRLEVGFMNQLIFRPDGIKIESNNTLQVGLTSAMSFAQ